MSMQPGSIMIAVAMLLPGYSGAANVDGLPTMEWGVEPAVVMEQQGGAWVGPQPMPQGLERWVTDGLLLGRPGELEVFAQNQGLVAWRFGVALEDACDAEASRRVFDELYAVLADRLPERAVFLPDTDGPFGIERVMWRNDRTSMVLERFAYPDAYRVMVSVTSVEAADPVWAATAFVDLESIALGHGMLSLRWGAPRTEVLPGEPGWGEENRMSLGVTRFSHEHTVLGWPARSVVVFADDQLVAWATGVEIDGDAQVVDGQVRAVSLLLEAMFGPPTSGEGPMTLWTAEVVKIGVVQGTPDATFPLMIAALGAPWHERAELAFRLAMVGVMTSDFPDGKTGK